MNITLADFFLHILKTQGLKRHPKLHDMAEKQAAEYGKPLMVKERDPFFADREFYPKRLLKRMYRPVIILAILIGL